MHIYNYRTVSSTVGDKQDLIELLNAVNSKDSRYWNVPKSRAAAFCGANARRLDDVTNIGSVFVIDFDTNIDVDLAVGILQSAFDRGDLPFVVAAYKSHSDGLKLICHVKIDNYNYSDEGTLTKWQSRCIQMSVLVCKLLHKGGVSWFNEGFVNSKNKDGKSEKTESARVFDKQMLIPTQLTYVPNKEVVLNSKFVEDYPIIFDIEDYDYLRYGFKNPTNTKYDTYYDYNGGVVTKTDKCPTVKENPVRNGKLNSNNYYIQKVKLPHGIWMDLSEQGRKDGFKLCISGTEHSYNNYFNFGIFLRHIFDNENDLYNVFASNGFFKYEGSNKRYNHLVNGFNSHKYSMISGESINKCWEYFYAHFYKISVAKNAVMLGNNEYLTLPVHRSRIEDVINKNSECVLIGGTGCGKTTLINDMLVGRNDYVVLVPTIALKEKYLNGQLITGRRVSLDYNKSIVCCYDTFALAFEDIEKHYTELGVKPIIIIDEQHELYQSTDFRARLTVTIECINRCRQMGWKIVNVSATPFEDGYAKGTAEMVFYKAMPDYQCKVVFSCDVAGALNYHISQCKGTTVVFSDRQADTLFKKYKTDYGDKCILWHSAKNNKELINHMQKPSGERTIPKDGLLISTSVGFKGADIDNTECINVILDIKGMSYHDIIQCIGRLRKAKALNITIISNSVNDAQKSIVSNDIDLGGIKVLNPKYEPNAVKIQRVYSVIHKISCVVINHKFNIMSDLRLQAAIRKVILDSGGIITNAMLSINGVHDYIKDVLGDKYIDRRDYDKRLLIACSELWNYGYSADDYYKTLKTLFYDGEVGREKPVEVCRLDDLFMSYYRQKMKSFNTIFNRYKNIGKKQRDVNNSSSFGSSDIECEQSYVDLLEYKKKTEQYKLHINKGTVIEECGERAFVETMAEDYDLCCKVICDIERGERTDVVMDALTDAQRRKREGNAKGGSKCKYKYLFRGKEYTFNELLQGINSNKRGIKMTVMKLRTAIKKGIIGKYKVVQIETAGKAATTAD